jgi:hypothetical protein
MKPYLLPLFCTLVLGTALLGETKNLAINPALIYWQGIGTLGDLSKADEALLIQRNSGQGDLDLPEAKALLSKHDVSLQRFLKASRQEMDCDWGLTLEDGPFTIMPHLNKLQTLSKLALLKAEVLFADDNPAQALDWILAVHRAARHAAASDTLVTSLVQYRMETQAIQATARRVLSLSEMTRKDHAQKLQSLKPLRTVAQSMSGERNFAKWSSQQADAAVMEMLLQMTNQVTSEADQTQPAPATPTAQEFQHWVSEMGAFHDKAEKALAKPWSEARIDLQGLEAAIAQSSPLVCGVATSLIATRDSQARVETLRIMLDIALNQGSSLNEDQLTGSRDAFAGQPISLRREKEGSLRMFSVQKVRNKEVSLLLAAPAKITQP